MKKQIYSILAYFFVVFIMAFGLFTIGLSFCIGHYPIWVLIVAYSFCIIILATHTRIIDWFDKYIENEQ